MKRMLLTIAIGLALTVSGSAFAGSQDESLPVQEFPSADPAGEMDSCFEGCADSKYKSATEMTEEDLLGLVTNIKKTVKDDPAVIDPDKPVFTVSSEIDPDQALPSIDIEVLFAFNSDSIELEEYAVLGELARVLKAPKYDSSLIVFVGHTDAKGTHEYNLDLSRRRAAAVARYMAQVGVPAERIQSNGVAFDHLKSPGDPFGAENRRVQVVLLPLQG